MLERRRNPIGRAATASVPRVSLGGLRIAVLDMEDTATFMIEAAMRRRERERPVFLTSANGEVLSLCATDPEANRLFRAADMISADGQPLVVASRLRSATRLPERVATTDLFHVVATKAAVQNLTFYMFGATEQENRAAVRNARRMHPDLRIVGRSHGYLDEQQLERKVDEINALAPDVLWIGLGVPNEQHFVEKFSQRLGNVGVIKTSGGLFNFLSGTRARAPRWMQAVGLEWAWRIAQEPRRLFWRYATTNPRALYLLFVRGDQNSPITEY
jgi:N-acetylglucosaminyldiphosphoundecaprenol N-acetyl-beta-D-mannosaminyltransferase